MGQVCWKASNHLRLSNYGCSIHLPGDSARPYGRVASSADWLGWLRRLSLPDVAV